MVPDCPRAARDGFRPRSPPHLSARWPTQTIKDGGNEYAAFEERHPLTMAIYAQRAQGHQTDGTGGISIGKPLFLTGRMFASIHFEIIEEEHEPEPA